MEGKTSIFSSRPKFALRGMAGTLPGWLVDGGENVILGDLSTSSSEPASIRWERCLKESRLLMTGLTTLRRSSSSRYSAISLDVNPSISSLNTLTCGWISVWVHSGRIPGELAWPLGAHSHRIISWHLRWWGCCGKFLISYLGRVW